MPKRKPKILIPEQIAVARSQFGNVGGERYWS